MSKGTLAAVVLGGFLWMAPQAEASSLTFNFCPGNASCNANLTEASLTFTSVDGTADVNDYTLTVTFKGSLTNTFIDSIDFTGGIDFASLPVLTSAPSGTALADWATQFDKVNNGGSNCAGGGGDQLFACSKSTTGNGPDFAGTNTWIYSVDFTGSSLITASSAVNLRALFVNADGTKVGAIMSPDGNVVSTTATPTTNGAPTTTGNVPEPALLSLFGMGLMFGARHLRKGAAR